ncbi:hypothetical protein BSL82_15865 [Tardibacter chloracetimidivorans]|uniref:Uncharacterized protein n=1 Tax=Tardibacter chloracetimidivorans TaxID=1921510 RepID=A0A1L3ZY80_9SPHN|nr:hypothetical protein [Tardibacter chloracetimidivorans]API60582.1 hypothetical protein BSL82_15865 [Tardibacter chloracetimidivorans]
MEDEDKPLAQMSLAELHGRRDAASTHMTYLKGVIADIDAEVAGRLSGSAASAFEQAGKVHGTMTLPLQDGMSAKVEISKKVEWDSDVLMRVAQTMPWERVTSVFKIAFAVPEKIYEGIQAVDPVLTKTIDTARTVKYGAPKITLVKEA